MVTRQERDQIKHIAERRADTVSFLSGDRKPEQERSACAAFLRGLGYHSCCGTSVLLSVPRSPLLLFFARTL